MDGNEPLGGGKEPLDGDIDYEGRALEERNRRRRVARLDSEIGELAGHLSAATARLLALVDEFDSAGGWVDQGAVSLGQWLSWRCGLGPAAARDYARVAGRLGELPATREAFTAGAISFPQARALCRAATPETEATLLTIARHSTVSQLERIVSAFAAALRSELDVANRRHTGRAFACYFDDDGFLKITGRLTPEDGAVVAAALRAAEDELAAERAGAADEGEDPTPAQLGADALVRVAEGSLAATGGCPEAHQAVVEVDLASLRDDSGARCELREGPTLAPETARRLTCDAPGFALTTRDGEALDVGRRTRRISARLRRALEARDRTCRFPGCSATRLRQSHHVRHWTRGGPTRLANLALLCRFHHRLVHEGGFGMVVTAGEKLRFSRPDGTEIEPAAAPRSGCLQTLARDNAKRGLGITPDTCRSQWDGHSIDLDLSTAVLCQQAGVLERPQDRHGEADGEPVAEGRGA